MALTMLFLAGMLIGVALFLAGVWVGIYLNVPPGKPVLKKPSRLCTVCGRPTALPRQADGRWLCPAHKGG